MKIYPFELNTSFKKAYSAQVEHDLLLSRILVELFNNAFLSSKLAFRGGTAMLPGNMSYDYLASK